MTICSLDILLSQLWTGLLGLVLFQIYSELELWSVLSRRLPLMGEEAEKAMGLLLNLCHLLFLPNSCPGFDGSSREWHRRRWSWPVAGSGHLSTHMSFFFFTWTPGYDGLCLGIKDSPYTLVPWWDPRICYWVRKETQDWVRKQGWWEKSGH